jgi:hypothetical protein
MVCWISLSREFSFITISDFCLKIFDNFNLKSFFYDVKHLSLNGYLKNDVLNKISNNIILKRIQHFQFPSEIDDLNGFYQPAHLITHYKSHRILINLSWR